MTNGKSPLSTRLRWKIGDFVGRWISSRLGSWIEGPLS